MDRPGHEHCEAVIASLERERNHFRMRNPLLNESRDARLALNLRGFCDKLRVPAVLHEIVMRVKPDHVSLGDHASVALLNDAIDTLQSRRDYRGVQRLLDTVFGPAGDSAAPGVPIGTDGNGRHP